MIAETTDVRPGADKDDGFATTESELAVYSGEAAERETLAGNGIVMACAGSGSIRTAERQLPIGEAQHYGITQYNARTDPGLMESTGASGTDTTAATTVACLGQCQPLG